MSHQVPQYSVQEYWEERYSHPSQYEWYQSFDGALRHVMIQSVPRSSKILQVGVGTSLLQAEMVKDGYKSIVNVDFSSNAIKHMQRLHHRIPELAYRVADCRQLTMFDDATFDAAIDKGTLDAMMCGDESDTSASLMLAEVDRVLRPGGVCLLITYGTPEYRLGLLNKIGWDVTIYSILKEPRLYTDSPGLMSPLNDEGSIDSNRLLDWAANKSEQEKTHGKDFKARSPHKSDGGIIRSPRSEPSWIAALQGPFLASNPRDVEAIRTLVDNSEYGEEGFHFVYVCIKSLEDGCNKKRKRSASPIPPPPSWPPSGVPALVDSPQVVVHSEGGQHGSCTHASN